MNKELKDIKELIQYVQTMTAKKERLEAEVKALNERIEWFSGDIIPEFMFSMGVSEVTLDDGVEISIETKYYGNISQERAEQAHKWLKENGFESLVKSTVGLSFGAGDEDKVDKELLTRFLSEHEINFNEKEAVHSQTLKSFIKHQMEDGKQFPYHLFGVHVAKQVIMG